MDDMIWHSYIYDQLILIKWFLVFIFCKMMFTGATFIIYDTFFYFVSN